MKEYIGKKYYEILGVPSSSTTEEIKSAYRKLARKYHPDLNPGNKASEQKFKEITEAYNVLISDTERAKYDTINGYNINTGTNRGQQSTKTASTQSSYQNKRNAKQAYSNTQKKDEQPKEFNTVFSEFMDGLFSQKNKKQTPPPKKEIPKPIKGSDITVDVNISPDEAVNGTVKQINVLYVSECKRCRGKKFINGSSCPMCNGEGELSTHNKIRVKIPQNVKEGSKIRISNEGNKGQNGGENGDLFLIVHIIKHSVLKYDGLNVLCTIPITPPEAALGASIEVPTKDGFLTMKIPPGTSSGQKFKLASEGLKDEKTKQTGDQIVTVEIVMNKNLSQEEKDLYQKLLRAQKINPRGDLLKS